MKVIDNIGAFVVSIIFVPLLVLLYAIMVTWWIIQFEAKQIARKLKKSF